MRFIFIALSILQFNTFADMCRQDSDCTFQCHHQAHCSHGLCDCRAMTPICSSDNDCSSHCHNGEHPHCSHYGGMSSCHCYECLTNSECVCQHGETGMCHKEFTFGSFRTHYCQCQAMTPICSSDNDCSGHCHKGEHPHCSHYGGVPSCHCYECSTDSECVCQPGETGVCHKGFTFGSFRTHYCQCQVQSTTTATSTTSSTTTISTTLPLVPLECKHHKISIIASIAENVHVEDSRASLCSGNNKHQSPEAYVINKCSSTEKNSWMRGLSVKSSCKSIQPYTPVATFFQNSNDLSGFFIGCTNSGDGFEIAAQTCSEPPMIFTLNETTTPRMSDFYTIQQWKSI